MWINSFRHPEDRFILECLRIKDTQSSIDVPERDRWDWNRFIDRAMDANVLQLVYDRLRISSTVPPTLLERMRETTIAAATRWLLLRTSAESILQALRDKNIPVVVLKGAALAPTIYEFPTLRVVGDLDLLLQSERLPAAEKVLQELGFQSRDSNHPSDHHHLPVVEDRLHNLVELHRHIVSETALFNKIPIDRLFALSRPFRLGKVESLMLSPEHLVIHACLHASLGHSFKGMLYQLCDIARIEREFPIDWDLVGQDTRQFGVEAYVFWGLTAARNLVAAHPPTQFVDSMGSPNVGVRRVMQWAVPELCMGSRYWSPRKDYFVRATCEEIMFKPSLTRAVSIVSKGGFHRRIRRILRLPLEEPVPKGDRH